MHHTQPWPRSSLSQAADGLSVTERDERSQRYRLGLKVVTLSCSVLARLPWRDAARPYLRQLMERTGECAHLAVAAQGRSLVVDQVECPASLRVNVQVGQASPLHCTALGKVFLAFGVVPIPGKLEPYTARTITDRTELRRALEKIRSAG